MRLAVPEFFGVCIARFCRWRCAAVQSAGSPSPPSRARHAWASLCLAAAAFALAPAPAHADEECGSPSHLQRIATSTGHIDNYKATCSADNYDPATEGDIVYDVPFFRTGTRNYVFDLQDTLRGDKAIRPGSGTVQDPYGTYLANPAGVQILHDGQGKVEIQTAADIVATARETYDDQYGYTYALYQFGIYAGNCPITGGTCGTPSDILVRMTGGTIRSADSAIHVQNGDTGSARVFATGGRLETTGDPTASDSVGRAIWAQSSGTGDAVVNTRNLAIATEGYAGAGVYGYHFGASGKVDLDILDGTTVTTAGARAPGVSARRNDAFEVVLDPETNTYQNVPVGPGGDIEIDLANARIETKSTALDSGGRTASYGVFGWHTGRGRIGIGVTGGTIATRGIGSHGLYGLHWNSRGGNTGDIDIRARGLVIETTGPGSHGIYGYNLGTGVADTVYLSVWGGTRIATTGDGSHGIYARGGRDRTVTVGGSVTGGSGTGAGINLAGGGTVVIDAAGSTGAHSGVAITSNGPLRVDVRLAGRKGGDAVRGVIRNTGTTTVRATAASEGDDWTTLLDADTVRDTSVRSGGYRVSMVEATDGTPPGARDWRFADTRVGDPPDPPDPPGPDPDADAERTPSSRSSSSSGPETAVLGVGAVFALIAAGDILFPVLLDDDEEESSGPADTASVPGFAPAKTRFAAGGGARQAVRTFDPDTPHLAGGSAVRVAGVQSLFDWPLGNGFRAGVSMAPDLSVSLPRSGAGGAAALRGGRYSVFGGWRGEHLSARATLAHDDWEARTSTANPLAEGGLSGAFGLRRTDVRLDLGARAALGPARVSLSAAAFGGEAVQEAHRARGPVYDAAMPERTWRYSGWKVGLGVASSGRLDGGQARWRAGLKMSATGLAADGGAFELAQRDRRGFLSFSGTVRPESVPETVFALGAAAELKTAAGWRLRLGYAGMAAGGGPSVHMVGAGVNLHF